MNLTIDTQGDRMVIALNGRLDAASGPALEARLPTEGVRELVHGKIRLDTKRSDLQTATLARHTCGFTALRAPPTNHGETQFEHEGNAIDGMRRGLAWHSSALAWAQADCRVGAIAPTRVSTTI